jgi:N-acetylglucosamine kinase-like BadF-type ATPase
VGALNGPHLLALDGGNSKTDVLLVTSDGTVVARARSGPFAPHIIGAGPAVATVAPAVEEVLAVAGLTGVDVVAGYLANADLPEEEDAIAEAIATYGWAERVEVHNDTFAMLRTGTDATAGVAVVCGGGINAVGIARDGRHVRYPALGRITGDWGGGFAIGKEVPWYASRDEDGRGPATLLSGLAARHFGCATAIEVATGMHLGTVDRDRMHELVPLLFAAVDAGDAVAAEIVQRQAEEIALLATTTLRRIHALDEPVDVVLGGGMLTSRHPALLEPVLAGIAAAAPRAVVSVVDDAPIVGSALLGLEHLDAHTGERGSPPARRERLRATLDTPQEVRR